MFKEMDLYTVLFLPSQNTTRQTIEYIKQNTTQDLTQFLLTFLNAFYRAQKVKRSIYALRSSRRNSNFFWVALVFVFENASFSLTMLCQQNPKNLSLVLKI